MLEKKERKKWREREEDNQEGFVGSRCRMVLRKAPLPDPEISFVDAVVDVAAVAV